MTHAKQTWRVLRYASIDSTSLLARRLIAQEGPPREGAPLAIIAATQSGGMGRLGRAWSSPAGGLWMTMIATFPSVPSLTGALGVRLGRAVLRAIGAAVERAGVTPEAVTQRVRLKLPNDIHVDGCKCAGVLIEVLRVGWRPVALIGVGVNANVDRDALAPDVRATAAVLREFSGAPIDLDALAWGVMDEVSSHLFSPAPLADVIADLTPRLANLGVEADVTRSDGTRVRARLAGISPSGAAMYDADTGRFEVASAGSA